MSIFDTNYKECTKGLSKQHLNELKWFNEYKGSSIPHSSIKNRKFANVPKGIYSQKSKNIVLAVASVIKSRYESKESKIFRNNEGGWYFEYAPEEHKSGMEFHTNKKLLNNSHKKIPIGLIYQVKEKPSLYEVVGTGLVRYQEDINMFQIYGFNDDGSTRFL